jgi:hypothetical protein
MKYIDRRRRRHDYIYPLLLTNPDTGNVFLITKRSDTGSLIGHCVWKSENKSNVELYEYSEMWSGNLSFLNLFSPVESLEWIYECKKRYELIKDLDFCGLTKYISEYKNR